MQAPPSFYIVNVMAVILEWKKRIMFEGGIRSGF